MPHIFISYSHKDRWEREGLVSALLGHGFTTDDIWFDRNIDTGEKWNDEIERALEDAVGIVLIVTPEAMTSMFVNFEWSWAKGYGKPVLPLLFREIPANLRHPILQIQSRDCRLEIGDDVIDEIRRLFAQPTLERMLDLDILELIKPAYVLSQISLLACRSALDKSNLERIPYHSLADKAQTEMQMLSDKKIPDFWYRHSFTFNRRQKRHFEELRVKTGELEDKLEHLRFYTQFQPEATGEMFINAIEEAEKYQIEEWEETLKGFGTNDTFKFLDGYFAKIRMREPMTPSDESLLATTANLFLNQFGDDEKDMILRTMITMQS